MTPVDRLTSRFEKSETQARNTARLQLDTILGNPDCLLALRGGEKKLRDALDLKARVESGETMTPNQYSYIDALYESFWKGAGMDSVPSHRDKKFSMRHPK